MCQRLYRPGYSIPELNVPPRRASACLVTPARSAGSNGVTVLVTPIPPAVTYRDSPSGGGLPKSASYSTLRSAIVCPDFVWPDRGRREKATAPDPGGRLLRAEQTREAGPPNGGATSGRPRSAASSEQRISARRRASADRAAAHAIA